MSAICIARVVHGSRLFGTASTESDTDLKSVWLPDGRDILLGRIDWTVFANDSSRRNSSHDTDHEQHDLSRFLKLLAAGHPTAAETVFAPENSFDEPPHRIWSSITALAPFVIPADVSKYMGFIEHQAAGFGVGGERLEAVQRALDVLTVAKARSPKCTVAEVAGEVVAAAASKHVRIDERPDGGKLLLIAGRSIHLGSRIGDAHRIAWMFIESFAAKTREQGASDRRDWRAASHAVRLAEEALELSTSGVITLPRPNADELAEIKGGAMSVADVAERMASLIPAVAEARSHSVLPAVPDVEAIEELVVDCHAGQVSLSFGEQSGLNLS